MGEERALLILRLVQNLAMSMKSATTAYNRNVNEVEMIASRFECSRIFGALSHSRSIL